MKRDGGPAFPTDFEIECPECKVQVWGTTPHTGMTLLDYFAGAALRGYMATCGDVHPDNVARIAEDCYRIAAGMLVERAKESA